MPDHGSIEVTSSDTLYGWKDISAYLGRSVRSVQRWEDELGLPVHRIKSSDGQTVYAKRSELDAWLKSRDLPKLPPQGLEVPDPSEAPDNSRPPAPETVRPPATKGPLVAGIAVAALLLGGVVGYIYRGVPLGPVTSIQVAGTEIIGLDRNGARLWATDVGGLASSPDGVTAANSKTGIPYQFSSNLFVVPVQFGRVDSQAQGTDVVFGLDASGRVLWRVQPEVALNCETETYTGPWQVSAIHASAAGGKTRIWVAYRHQTWWPSFVLEISPEGHASLRYLQDGWIRTISDWNRPEGRRLVVGGVSNAFERPVVAFIDPDGPPTSAPPSTPRFTCKDAPGDHPDTVVLLPALQDQFRAPYAMAVSGRASTKGFITEIELGGGQVIAEFSAPGLVSRFAFADTYWSTHRRLEAEGVVRHRAAACPEITRRHEVTTWTRHLGWNRSTVVADITRVASPQLGRQLQSSGAGKPTLPPASTKDPSPGPHRR